MSHTHIDTPTQPQPAAARRMGLAQHTDLPYQPLGSGWSEAGELWGKQVSALLITVRAQRLCGSWHGKAGWLSGVRHIYSKVSVTDTLIRTKLFASVLCCGMWWPARSTVTPEMDCYPLMDSLHPKYSYTLGKGLTQSCALYRVVPEKLPNQEPP